MRRNPRLDIIKGALRASGITNANLADNIYVALFGRPTEQVSPADRMEDAHRRRDFFGVIEAGNAGYRALKSSSWYPARAGDILHIHFEAVGDIAESGETYIVEHSEDEGGLVLRLLSHTLDHIGGAGAYAPGVVDDPFMDPWMEAGPHRLTIVRDGRVVHNGPEASR